MTDQAFAHRLARICTPLAVLAAGWLAPGVVLGQAVDPPASPAFAWNDRTAAQILEVFNVVAGRDATGISPLTLPGAPSGPLSVSVELEAGFPVTLDLFPVSYRGENYKVLVQRADGSFERIDPGPPRTMEGWVREIPGARVFGTLAPDGLHADVMIPGEPGYDIEPIYDVLPIDRSLHAAFVDQQTDLGDVVCGVNGELPADAARDPANGGASTRGLTGSDPRTCVELGVDVGCVAEGLIDDDYADVVSGIDSLASQTNSASSSVDVRYYISLLVIRTSPCPYGTSNIEALVEDVEDEWNDDFSEEPWDAVLHVTGVNQFIGIADAYGFADGVGGMCNRTGEPSAFAVIEYVEDLVDWGFLASHELGHLLGGVHVNETTCMSTPTVMCPGAFFMNVDFEDPVWDSTNKATIQGARDLFPCLARCPWPTNCTSEGYFTDDPFEGDDCNRNLTLDSCEDDDDEYDAYSMEMFPLLQDRTLTQTWEALPMALGTVTVTLEGIGRGVGTDTEIDLTLNGTAAGTLVFDGGCEEKEAQFYFGRDDWNTNIVPIGPSSTGDLTISFTVTGAAGNLDEDECDAVAEGTSARVRITYDTLTDTDDDGRLDVCEILDGIMDDDNGNRINDEDEDEIGLDCNDNDQPDSLELSGNDCNSNGLLDSCELADDGEFVYASSALPLIDDAGNDDIAQPAFHFFPDSLPDAVGPVDVVVQAQGGFGDDDQFVNAYYDMSGSVLIGAAFNETESVRGNQDCDVLMEYVGQIDESTFNSLNNNEFEIEARPQGDDTYMNCSDDSHTLVVLRYRTATDLDSDMSIDECEIAANGSLDCNSNGILDAVESQFGNDCDDDGTPDDCEMSDCDSDGVPDSCELDDLVVYESPPLGPVDDEIEQVFTISSPEPADGDVTILFETHADIGSSSDAPSFYLGSDQSGTEYEPTLDDGTPEACTLETGSVVIPGEDWNDAISGGSISIRVQPDSTVHAYDCGEDGFGDADGEASYIKLQVSYFVQPETVCPDTLCSLTMTHCPGQTLGCASVGSTLSGGVSDLCGDDGNVVSIRGKGCTMADASCFPADTIRFGEAALVADGDLDLGSCGMSVSELRLWIKGSTDGTDRLTLQVYFWDWSAGTFEAVGSPVSITTDPYDIDLVVSATSSPGQYIDTGGEVRAKVSAVSPDKCFTSGGVEPQIPIFYLDTDDTRWSFEP